MKSLRLFFLLLCFVCAGMGVIFAQVANDYRSAQSGNWNAVSSWQKYTGSAWAAATLIPDSSVGKIDILPGHTITVTANVVVDSVYVDSSSTGGVGGSLVIAAGDTITVGPPNAKTLTAPGISVQATGQSYAGTMIVNGCYRHARDGGSWPMATWNVGSTCLTAPGAVTLVTVPNNRSQAWYNFEWNCPNQTGNLALNLTGTKDSIRGNFVLRATGSAGRLYLTSPGTSSQVYAGPIHIFGNFIEYNGQFGVNGSSSPVWSPLTNYDIIVDGDILVNGSGRATSWFAIARGSAVQTIFHAKGNVIFKACSLTTSNNADSKIIFEKGSGTQNLAVGGDCNIGSSSAFSFQVASGSTVNIDTFQIPGTGTFVLNNGGALKQTCGTITGNITCTGANNTVAYNNFAIARATTGSGTVTILATTPANSNLSDPTLSMPRYYTITADPGVTIGTIYIPYPVTEVPGGVTEGNMVPAKYSGVGTNWNPMGPVVNTTEHSATSNAGVDLNGVWAVVDGTLTGVSNLPTSGIPGKFSVGQNYPNPFNPGTTIAYSIPKASLVTIKVYSLLGQEIATLFSGYKSAGTYQVPFDASHLSSGVYLYRVEAGKSTETKRMVLMK
jgi:hypothetical protein